jgi:hypothetical protein
MADHSPPKKNVGKLDQVVVGVQGAPGEGSLVVKRRQAVVILLLCGQNSHQLKYARVRVVTVRSTRNKPPQMFTACNREQINRYI